MCLKKLATWLDFLLSFDDEAIVDLRLNQGPVLHVSLSYLYLFHRLHYSISLINMNVSEIIALEQLRKRKS